MVGALGSIVLGVGVNALRHGRGVAPALAALLVLAAAGCSSDAQPSPMPTPSSTPSESASPRPTPPTMPAAAEGTSPAAAKAFARYFLETINYGMSSGDTTALRAVAAPGCETCLAIADKIDQSHAGPAYLEGAGWQPQGFQYIRIAADRALVAVPLAITAQKSYASAGATPTVSAATRGSLDLRLSRTTGRWQVTQLDATQ